MKFRLNVPAMSVYPGGKRHWFEDMTPDEIVRVAQAADELGYDSLHVPEHVLMHVDEVEKMGPRWVHVTTARAYVAAATKRIDIAGLIVVPYHNPIELAKSLSTMDWLSGGRVIMVAAVGYMEWEYEVLRSPPFADRGRAMDEYMQAMIELWTADRPEFDGTYVSFRDVVFEPRAQPRIWLAGNSKAAVRRAARYADGWSPNAMTRARLAEQIEVLREQPGFAERDRPFDVFLNLFEREVDLNTHEVKQAPRVVVQKDAILEQVHELAALGVTMTDVDSVIGGGTGSRDSVGAKPVRSVDDLVERLQWFAEEIFPEARAL
jgi:probable F420-dependent oxidoreductase